MANCIGYERLSVGSTAVGPSEAFVGSGKGPVACAIFHLDPESSSDVRWRPDGGLTGPTHSLPSSSDGGLIQPGGHVTVVGTGNIRNSRFVSRFGSIVSLHCYYFDQVDVVGFDPSGVGLSASTPSATDLKIVELLERLVDAADEAEWND